MSYHVNPIAPVLPRLGARSVGALGTLAPLRMITLDQAVAGKTKFYGAASGAFYRACMTDPLAPVTPGSPQHTACIIGSDKEIPTLKGDQLEFYKNCMAQKPSDIPVATQHRACYGEAKKLSAGGAAAPAPVTSSAPEAAPAPSGGLPGGKWLWIGGAVAAAGLAFVLLKR